MNGHDTMAWVRRYPGGTPLRDAERASLQSSGESCMTSRRLANLRRAYNDHVHGLRLRAQCGPASYGAWYDRLIRVNPTAPAPRPWVRADLMAGGHFDHEVAGL